MTERQQALSDFFADFEEVWPIYQKRGVDKGAAITHYSNVYYAARMDMMLSEILHTLRFATATPESSDGNSESNPS